MCLEEDCVRWPFISLKQEMESKIKGLILIRLEQLMINLIFYLVNVSAFLLSV